MRLVPGWFGTSLVAGSSLGENSAWVGAVADPGRIAIIMSSTAAAAAARASRSCAGGRRGAGAARGRPRRARAAAVRVRAAASAKVVEDRAQDRKGLLEAFTGGGVTDIPPSPEVVWGRDVSVADIREMRAAQAAGADALPVIEPGAGVARGDLDAEEADLLSRRAELVAELARSGALHFKGYELMKTAEGYHRFYDAMALDPCLDPIQAVAARPVSSAEHKIYEAVNKPSRANYVVGMHNEMVGTSAPRYAGFVCFKPAEEGGEFWVLGGNDLFHELDAPLLEKMQRKRVIFSVVEFPMGFINGLAEGLRQPAKDAIKAAVGVAVKLKVDFDVFFRFVDRGYDGDLALQGYASPQPAVILDPTSQLPVVFCNVHSHSRFLRDYRQRDLGELQATTGASQANKTDVSYGDNESLSEEELLEYDRAVMKCVKQVPMERGDVILLDNYRTMHGRGTFKGSRHNAVGWFSRLTR